MKTTQENNRLIAEFMGYQVVDKPKVVEGENFFQYLDEKTNKYTYCASLLMYNYNWDWLMPVVEKIESMQSEEYSTLIEGRSCLIETPDILFEGTGKNKLEATYKAVVQFIEWWNEQNTAKKNS